MLTQKHQRKKSEIWSQQSSKVFSMSPIIMIQGELIKTNIYLSK